MAPPRQGAPVWLLVLGGLLIINIAVLTVVLLRGNHSAAPTADTSPVPTPTTAPATPPPIPAAPPPMAASPAIITSPSIPPQISTAPAAAPSDGASADDAPAVEPSRAPVQTQAQPDPRVAGAAGAGVPPYEQAASTPGASLPDLKLDYHQYDNNPARRVIFLNMVTLREGGDLSGRRARRIHYAGRRNPFLAWFTVLPAQQLGGDRIHRNGGRRATFRRPSVMVDPRVQGHRDIQLQCRFPRRNTSRRRRLPVPCRRESCALPKAWCC